MLDRLLHRATVVGIDGPSYRLRAHQHHADTLRKGVNAPCRLNLDYEDLPDLLGDLRPCRTPSRHKAYCSDRCKRTAAADASAERPQPDTTTTAPAPAAGLLRLPRTRRTPRLPALRRPGHHRRPAHHPRSARPQLPAAAPTERSCSAAEPAKLYPPPGEVDLVPVGIFQRGQGRPAADAHREGMAVARAKGKLRGKKPKLSPNNRPNYGECTLPATTRSLTSPSCSPYSTHCRPHPAAHRELTNSQLTSRSWLSANRCTAATQARI